ncbi:hypothetical protein NMG60_11033283 [Bertholletia excelsa]
MAPKRRSGNVVGAVVRRTRRVVQETVQVAVVERKRKPKNKQDEVPQVVKSVKEVVVQEGRSTQEEENEALPPKETPQQEEAAPATPSKPVKEVVVQETRSTHEEENETLSPEEAPQQEEEAPTTPWKLNEQPKSQETKEEEVEDQNPKQKEAKPQETQKTKRVRAGEGGGDKKKRRRGTRQRGAREGYKRYVYRVMKQVHPDMGISAKAMTVLNNFMSDMFERLAAEAATLSRYTEKTTLSAREVQGAVRLVLPGELGKHAVAEGAKAVANYLASVTQKS